MISLADGRASAVGLNSLDAWTLWTLILETEFQNMNNNINLGALGFKFGTLDTHFRDKVLEYEQQYKVGGIRVQLWDSRCYQSKQNGSLHLRSLHSRAN